MEAMTCVLILWLSAQITSRRIQALSIIYASIQSIIVRRSLGNFCDHDDENSREVCDSTIAGSLIRNMSKARIWPAPAPPYRGVSIRSIVTLIQDMRLQSFCNNSPRNKVPIPIGFSVLRSDESDETDPSLLRKILREEGYGLAKFMRMNLNPLLEQDFGLKIEQFQTNGLKRKLEGRVVAE